MSDEMKTSKSWFTKSTQCPYCETDIDEVEEDNFDKMECPHCGETFIVDEASL